MRKLDDANFVDVGFFLHDDGKRLPINGVKYFRRSLFALDDVGTKRSAVDCEAELLFDAGGDNLVVDDEGSRRRK